MEQKKIASESSAKNSRNSRRKSKKFGAKWEKKFGRWYVEKMAAAHKCRGAHTQSQLVQLHKSIPNTVTVAKRTNTQQQWLNHLSFMLPIGPSGWSSACASHAPRRPCSPTWSPRSRRCPTCSRPRRSWILEGYARLLGPWRRSS